MIDLQNPKFSIIIPMYNVEKFVARAMKSALNQSYENIEIICVDDCGGDKSVEIAKEFALSDKRVKILQNPQNLGTFATRNNGAINAKGEYLLFLDGDDYLHPDTCQKCYEVLENANTQEQQIDFIMFNLFGEYKQGEGIKLHKVVRQTQIIDDYAFESMYFGKDTNFCFIVLKCIKRETYLKALDFANVGKKVTVAEDTLMSMAILGVSKKIALLDFGLYYYTYNGDSATRSLESSKIKERIQNISFVIEKLAEFANKKDKPYKIFVQGVGKTLETHIIGNKIHSFIIAYQNRIDKGFPKFLARLILSLQRRRFGAQKAEKIY